MPLTIDVIARFAVLAFGGLLLLHFCWSYLGASIALLRTLGAAARQLGPLQKAERSTLKRQLGDVFQREPLKHLWTEFEETLHEQRATKNGTRQLVDVRATVPAEAFFNTEAIVDSSLRTEYFKHLPGVFTGLGIIGTFAGLIAGLIAFDPSGDPDALKRSLDGLFDHVKDAFLVSAVAIGAAILVTLVEKLVYAAAVRRTLAVAQGIDKLFRSGIGEEYLASLVQSTQESATQTRQLRDSLVEDLKILLTNLTNQQIAATQTMGEQLGRQIEASLKTPIETIAASVKELNRGQGDAVQSTLESLLAAFMARMEEVFGGQIGQLNALMQQTAQSISQAQASLQGLVGDLRSSSEQAGTSMREQLTQMLGELVSQQQAMFAVFESAQRAATEEASGGLARVQQQLGDMATEIATRQSELAREDESRRQRSDDAMQKLLNALDQRVAGIIDSNSRTQAETEARITAIQAVSTKAIDGLSEAANSIRNALGEFNAAGARLTGAMKEAAASEGRVVQASQTLSDSAANLKSTAQGLGQALNTLGAVSVAMQSVSRSLESEADGRRSVIDAMRTTADHARKTAEQMRSFFADIESQLKSTFQTFGDGVTQALSKSLAEYDRQLSSSVTMLKSAMDDLSERLDT